MESMTHNLAAVLIQILCFQYFQYPMNIIFTIVFALFSHFISDVLSTLDDNVANKLASILVDTGTTIDDKIDSILVDTGTTLNALISDVLSTLDDNVASELTAIKSDVKVAIPHLRGGKVETYTIQTSLFAPKRGDSVLLAFVSRITNLYFQ